MATEILIKNGTAIVLADSTDHSPAAGNDLGTRTAQIDLTSLASGAYRMSDKIDFGATRSRLWGGRGAFEFSTAPTAGGTIEMFIGWSHSGTAGTGNPGNLSGSDGAYVGYGAAATDADECIGQLDFLGAIPVSNDADVHIGEFGLFVPRERYGIVVLHDGTDQAFIADAVEMSIRLYPIIDESQ